jgi:hypothetical protein
MIASEASATNLARIFSDPGCLDASDGETAVASCSRVGKGDEGTFMLMIAADMFRKSLYLCVHSHSNSSRPFVKAISYPRITSLGCRPIVSRCSDLFNSSPAKIKTKLVASPIWILASAEFVYMVEQLADLCLLSSTRHH